MTEQLGLHKYFCDVHYHEELMRTLDIVVLALLALYALTILREKLNVCGDFFSDIMHIYKHVFYANANGL